MSAQMRCGGHLGLQGWCRAMGMGCKYVWLANAARAGVPLALLGARGGWRLRARGGVHLHGSRGGGSRRRLVAAPSLVATPKPLRTCRTSSPPPKVRALAKKIILTKLETCTKDDTTERGGWASSQKLPAEIPTARAWCINMHPLGVLHSLLPPKNSLDPPTHRLTRGAMGAGSP